MSCAEKRAYSPQSNAPVRPGEANAVVTRSMIMSKLLLFVIVALISSLTSSAQQTSWKDYLGGPDSSHYSALKQINTSNVNKLDVAWSYPTGDDTSYTFSPLVVDNIAYFAARTGSLVAVDATTGKELWVHPFAAAGYLPASAASRACAARTTGRARIERTVACSCLREASCRPSMRGPASWWTPSPITGNLT